MLKDDRMAQHVPTLHPSKSEFWKELSIGIFSFHCDTIQQHLKNCPLATWGLRHLIWVATLKVRVLNMLRSLKKCSYLPTLVFGTCSSEGVERLFPGRRCNCVSCWCLWHSAFPGKQKRIVLASSRWAAGALPNSNLRQQNWSSWSRLRRPIARLLRTPQHNWKSMFVY